MYAVFIDTANIVDAPPFVRAVDKTTAFLGPGTKADVFFTIVGDRTASRRVTISGTTGKITYDGRDTGARAKMIRFYHHLMCEPEPFTAGKRTVIQLGLEPPLELGEPQSIMIGHNGAGPGSGWYLQKVRIVSPSGSAVEFTANVWLVEEQREVKITPETITYVIPTGLTLTHVNDQLLAYWQAVPGASGYEFQLRDANDTIIFTYPPEPVLPERYDKTRLEEIYDPFVEMGRFTTSALKLNNQGHAIVVNQGGIIQASMEINHYCPSCGGAINQIIVGLGGEDQAQVCVWNGGQSSGGWLTVSFSLNIPDKPGVYYIRTRYAQAYTCNDALAWWQVDRPDGPTSASNIGRVIIPERAPERDRPAETEVTVPAELLSKGSAYTARVRAILGDIPSDWSNPVTFKVPQEAAEIKPTVFDETHFDQSRFDSASDWA